MSTTGRTETSAPAASDLAAALAEADFVRLLARADGDALAATGVLGGVLAATDTPFQASVVDPFDAAAGATGADYTVAVGDPAVRADGVVGEDGAASATAFDVAGELVASDGDAADTAGLDPVLALAGTIAADEGVPSVVDAGEAVGVERQAGVSVPVADLADGLAHSTLFHASFSGDVDAARSVLADVELDDALDDDALAALEEDDRRRLASLVALEASSAEGATERAAESIERALRPFVGGPFATVGGYADVLDAAARRRPGVALSMALGHEGSRESALAAWREHGTAAHAALSDGDTERHDGLFVVRRRSMPVGTVARLAADFRSPEPVVLAVADGEAAIRAVDDRDAATALSTAVDTLDGTAIGTGDRGIARFETDEDRTDDWTDAADGFVAAVREAL